LTGVKKCPKCGNEMEKPMSIRLSGKWIGYLTVAAYVCGKCGYVEFYRE
jgi:predicted nucleic-acid-binding Zn-ribbon protein